VEIYRESGKNGFENCGKTRRKADKNYRESGRKNTEKTGEKRIEKNVKSAEKNEKTG
jgi:hypothetical protein